MIRTCTLRLTDLFGIGADSINFPPSRLTGKISLSPRQLVAVATLFGTALTPPICISGCGRATAITHQAMPQQELGAAGHSNRADRTLLTLGESHLDFGVLAAGSRHKETFSVQNLSRERVEVQKIETSCECFQVTIEKTVIWPGEKVLASASVDFSDDPNFVGRLRLEAVGRVKQNSIPAFVLCVDVGVR